METIVKFPLAANFGLCSHKFVAVGGGGSGSTFGIDGSYYHGAGGSGYIESFYIDISSAEYYLVKVGEHGQNSFVENENGETILIASYGFDNLYDNGGHGYSGGGSGSINYGEGGKGGSDGSKGGGAHGGSGNSFDVSDISYLEHFVLTPGDGGDPHDRCGGGGGGVLVNNHGPTSAYNQGKGFGGGGGSGDLVNSVGSPGVVLLEVKSK